MHDRSARRGLGPVRWTMLGVLTVVALVAGGSALSDFLTMQSYPKDMQGNPVISTQPSANTLRRINAVDKIGSRSLRVPSAGLDVPLGALNEVDGVIDPPGFSSAYLVRNYGATLASAQAGTVFVAMHSCRGGAVCPGNALINVDAGTASVRTGADVYVAGLHYRVTGWQKVFKPDVHDTASIWENTPGRLVLLTCLQNPEQTASIDNMVISAELVP